MNLDKLKALLIKHEGERKFPYLDTVGKLTIGVGHNLSDKGLTTTQIRVILLDDINETLAFMLSHIPVAVQLDEVRQCALADMTFNLMGKMLDFKGMLGALQAKNWQGASDHLLNSLFARQTGQRARDLALMLKTGQYGL